MNFKTAVQWTCVDVRRAARHIFVNDFAGSVIVPRLARYFLYRMSGIRTQSASILPGVFFDSSAVTIGRGVFINTGCKFFSGEGNIVLDDDVEVAMNVTFLAETHKIGSADQRGGDLVKSSLHVGKGCWIGANVVILPGVDIAPGCVIAAGAVVVKNCEANGLYAGIPARRIRDLS